MILGLIPARGGSKGIPRKNIKMLNGKPLIQYAIDAGIGAKSISKVVVSTEDEEIAATAKRLGAEVPILRPAELASDHSPTLDTVIFMLEYYKKQGVKVDAVCLLQATSPFRSASNIDEAIDRFKTQDADSLVSVIKVPHEYNPHWVFEPDQNNLLKIATGEKTIISRRQELPPAYIRNGAIYIAKASVILEQYSLYGEKIAFYEMSNEHHVNLDEMTDWEKAERMIRTSSDLK